MDVLQIHVLAKRLPDQLVPEMIETADAPPAEPTDETHECFLPQFGDAHIRFIVHWQPPTPAPNALERATMMEAISHFVAESAITVAKEAMANEQQAAEAPAQSDETPAPPENA